MKYTPLGFPNCNNLKQSLGNPVLHAARAFGQGRSIKSIQFSWSLETSLFLVKETRERSANIRNNCYITAW